MKSVVITSNMKAKSLIRQRLVYAENKFAELVLWELPESLDASPHHFKYRLAYVVNQVCVLRYDNEAGKGDHADWGNKERAYKFLTADKLLADFFADIERWNNENRDS